MGPLTLLDLVNHLVGGLLAEIVDDDVGAKLGVHDGIRAAESSTRTSDDDGLAIEADIFRLSILLDLLGALEQALDGGVSWLCS